MKLALNRMPIPLITVRGETSSNRWPVNSKTAKVTSLSAGRGDMASKRANCKLSLRGPKRVGVVLRVPSLMSTVHANSNPSK